jgi:hypothetical protein
MEKGGRKMNIRMGDGAVRCRISCEELEFLLTGKKLEEPLTLAGKPVLLTIDPAGEKLSLIYEEGRIGLKAPMNLLKELDQKGRQKSGVVQEVGGASLSLQVDLKTYAKAGRV